jgi:RNA-directed DNA polymerase
VARPWERKFLGFSFTNHQQPKRRLAPKAVARFKERVRELTRRKRGISLVRMVHDLAEYLRGWIGYFGRCETPEVLDKLEKWLRRRLRSMVWNSGSEEPQDIGSSASAASLRRTPRKRRVAPMDSGTLRTPQRRKSLCPTLTSPRSDFPSSRLMVSSTRRTAACGPHVRSCGRGEWATTPPMPIWIESGR